MSRQHDTDDDQHIEVLIDSILCNVDLDDEVTMTLPAWQWIAFAKLAEHHGVDMGEMVQRWIRDRTDRLATHVEGPTSG